MATTSHAVKATDLTVAYPSTGPNSGYAVLHATGCRHTSRKSNYGEARHLGTGFVPYADDYFEVAPCAR
jgi:hypothetical protein